MLIGHRSVKQLNIGLPSAQAVHITFYLTLTFLLHWPTKLRRSEGGFPLTLIPPRQGWKGRQAVRADSPLAIASTEPPHSPTPSRVVRSAIEERGDAPKNIIFLYLHKEFK